MDVGVQTTEDESTEHMHLLSPMPLTFTVKVKLNFHYSLAITIDIIGYGIYNYIYALTEFDQFHRKLNRLRTIYAKQKHLGCKKVWGQSEATLQTGRHDQKV